MTKFMTQLMARTRVGDGTINLNKFLKAVEEGVIADTLLKRLANGEERLLTPQEVEKMTGFKLKQIYYWVRIGELPETIQIGKLYFILESELERLLETRKVGLTSSSK